MKKFKKFIFDFFSDDMKVICLSCIVSAAVIYSFTYFVISHLP